MNANPNHYNTPCEITAIWIQNGITKAALPIMKMILLGLAAGAYIGFGAHAFLLATSAGGSSALTVMLTKLAGAGLFPVGLMMVVLCGAELFTGNNLMTLALMDHKITIFQLIRNWIIVYGANLAGALILSFSLSLSGLYQGAAADQAVSVASAKISLPFEQALLRGIFCNILVILACWLQAGSRDLPGKILAIWFPIMLFVFSGFEHSVANMTYIPLAIFLHAPITWGEFFFQNLLPVTLGNLIGGALIIPVLYFLAYRWNPHSESE